ncbi:MULTISPECIES: 5-carboxymethyl-2-hydroxymuconate Delta-isomerase [unclassified Psychrobacter]|uniref:5-carboxymethyl-2-hydroxymuconate Delta-isomerase n=1 Tax=unclassified Psychrobacter TaxID=196806 RepID=UPI00086C1DCC|nr:MULTISPECIES: 5-carboxymethyl-2-hydroxymuconate Delta-isomerase [unclassified Psychrobacter]OEH68007.1 MAG: 5-carboxymethyl-2-hydroxymuconate isomerase [Psychrobacter sp. B29-1]PKG62171.1 5-carboxymethyl-2-hydroxymuconate isomerase [Psychrobacter sp. Choline-02u-13]PKH53270.1 5-carboxymethyl-2-hydroxymuconate isomerase [Psychrobacter sp. Choline-02u-9]
MPHLTIQVTPNVSIAHEESLLKSLNKALWDSGQFKLPTDIKARIVPIKSFLVGVEDDEQANGFIYAHLKLMSGRDMAARDQLAELLVATIEDKIGAEQSGRAALQICVEVEEISAVYHKKMLGS